MLSTIVVTYPWLTTAALVALLILGPLAGSWLTTRSRITGALLTLSILAVALFTLLPADRDLVVGCTVAWSLPTLGAVELMANLVLFVPPVLLAGILTGRPGTMLLVASGASAVIEVIQAFLPVLGRSCATNDWLANTLGAALGAVLAVAASRLATPKARPGGR
ncbi:VanZ like protein [Tamaricihabitans halophyticus]|uniref:VanZ like protein n=1 Tax=Tamaricihabitans halophyticus TaxID=1262583 RepID=A0A4R2Q548_9PSEU|nr:VanZ family protein [Tamaricihabitans halophyticus]TCP43609.1 VanZ like protein [Tamaricihabitans halophyticus]